MDTTQKSVYKKLGADNDYQSVVNVQKYQGAPYRAVKNEHIQLMHDDSGHWQLAFCSNERIQNCDSLKTLLGRVNRKWFLALYKNYVKEFFVSFLLVQKQTDWYNCGPFAVAFVAETLDKKSPMEARVDVERALDRLFGKESSHTIPESLIPFKCIRSSHWKIFCRTGSILQMFCRKKNTSCSTPMVEKL